MSARKSDWFDADLAKVDVLCTPHRNARPQLTQMESCKIGVRHARDARGLLLKLGSSYSRSDLGCLAPDPESLPVLDCNLQPGATCV